MNRRCTRVDQPSSGGEVARAAVRVGNIVARANGYHSFVASGEPVPAPVASVKLVAETQALKLRTGAWFPVISPPQDLMV